MALSSKEREAIAEFDHDTVRKVLACHGWNFFAVCDASSEVYESGGAELWMPERWGSVDGNLFVEIFAEAEGISPERAIALLSGNKTTTLTWHDAGTLPPVNVPLIVDIDGKHRAAEFAGDRLKFCNGSQVSLREGNWTYPIDAIAWEVEK